MSYEEKGAWVYGSVALAVWSVYVVLLLTRADGASPSDLPYVTTLLWTVGISAFLPGLARGVVEGVRPSETARRDVRDRDIHRRGEHVSGVVLGAAMVGPFALALVEAPHFWIANAMYTAFVLAAVVGSAVKVVAYRRGF